MIEIDELTIGFINKIDQSKWIWGTGIKEPKIAVEGIVIQRKDIIVQGKDYDSVTFEIDGIKFVQFKLKDGDPLYDFINDWGGEDTDEIAINIVGTCSINNYNSVAIPQFIISGVNVIKGCD